MNFFKTLFFVTIFSGLLASCEKDNAEATTQNTDFSKASLEYFESVSQYYPEGDVNMFVTTDEKGISTATYSLSGKSKEAAQLGILAAKKGDGTTCSSALSCGKALKKCLDGGQDGTISNGSCATYCVTCSDPK